MLPRECTGHGNTLFQNTREDSTHGHHQMVNTKIRLIIFFAAKDGDTVYSQQKQDRELTVAQIMNSLLPNSELLIAKLNFLKGKENLTPWKESYDQPG